MKRTKLVLILVMALLFGLYAQEQVFYPVIENYSFQSYEAGTSNWSVIEDDRGIMFFANNQGVLEYDGQTWRKIESPDREVARSLAKDENGKIYVGFVGDIGYLTSDEIGQAYFLSLKDQLPEKDRQFKEVWTTHFLNGNIYFQTKSKIFRWDGEKMKVLVSDNYFQSANIVDGQYYIGVWKKGLCKLNEERFELDLILDEFSDKQIYMIQPFAKDTLLIGTRKDGLFLGDSGNSRPFPTEADKLVEGQLYSPGLSINRNRFLLNTLGNGVLFIDRQGKLLQQFSKDIGLQDNTVNSVYLDSRGILWLALFNGISSIDLGAPFTYLNDDLGLPFKTIYDLEQHQGNLYAGTISGVFVMDQKKGQFQFIEETYGQTYQLFKFRNRLYGAGYGMGFFEIVDDKIRYVKRNTNDDFKVTMIRQSKLDKNRIFLDWREGLVSYYFNEAINQFQEESGTTKFHPTYKGFEVDNTDRVWILGNKKGTVKCLQPKRIDGQYDLNQSEIVEFDSTHGLPNNLKYIFQENNRLHFLSETFHCFEESQNRFEECIGFYAEMYDANAQFFSYPIEDKLGRIWIQPGKGIVLHNSQQETKQSIINPFLPLKDFPTWNILIDEASTADKTIAWFNGTQGIARYEGNPEIKKAGSFNAIIREVVMNEDSLLSRGNIKNTQPVKINHGNGNLTFNYAATIYTHKEAIRYQTKLEGFDQQWSTPGSFAERQFFNLPTGNYSFKIKAINILQNESEIASYDFKIIPNWWQSWWMYVLYSLVGGLLLYGIINALIKRSTRQLEARQKELEDIVAQRTAQIEKDKAFIEEQSEELKAMDKIKSRFFANISHELRTPLTLILGPLSYILDNPKEWDKANIKKQLTVMQRNGKSLLQLIEEILDLSKLEAKKLDLVEEATPLTQFFEYLFFVFEPQFQANDLEYELQLELREDLQVLLDRRKLEKVLNNFLSNAIKFSSKNGKIILKVVETAEQIKIKVSDNGKGIHPDDLPYIFERFYQSKQADQKLYGGTGIGLALVQEFAQLMNGKVHAESVLGSGSVFYFEFPKKEIALAEVVNLEAVKTIEENPTESIGTDFTIMVVEDNPDMRSFITQLLTTKYQQILVAQNGAEGLKLLQEKGTKIDLIVSDVMMPEVDGLEMLKQIKSHSEWFGIPVIMLTALAAERDKLSALTIGVDDYLIKPFSVPELMIRVQNLLYNYHQRKQILASEAKDLKERDQNKSIQAPSEINVSDKKWIAHLQEIIEESMANEQLSVEFLASAAFLSSRQLARKVKGITGLTPAKLIREVRLESARKIMEKESLISVSEVAYQCGFEHPTTFSTLFKKRFGKSPSEYSN